MTLRTASTVALAVYLLGGAVGSLAEESASFGEATYLPSDAPLANPERGIYVELDDRRQQPLERRRLDELTERGITLVQRLYYLKGYRDRPLDAAQLDLVQSDFDTVRAAGMKVILRFAYSSRIGEPDAPLPTVRGHLDQLTPLLRENADLILTMQAGFVGAWGEWHASTNGLDEPEAMREIATLLLEILPPDRTIQVRTPWQKQRIVGHDRPLDAATLDRGSVAARVGHHNDCFLADESDTGTYRDRSLAEDRAYAAADSRYVPVGGETCRNGPRSDPSFAAEEMARLHWSFLNLAYHRGVIAKWRGEGFLPQVQERLGYRLRLDSVRLAKSVAPGERLTGSLRVVNDGWAAPINPRPVMLLLRPATGGDAFRLELVAEVRDWHAGATHTVALDCPVPADANPGEYSAHLALPDPSPRLAGDPRYAVRLANEAIVADDATHDLGLRLTIGER